MEDDIKKVIDARQKFKLAQLGIINERRANRGEPPLTLKEYENNLNAGNVKNTPLIDNHQLNNRNRIARESLSVQPEDIGNYSVKEIGSNLDERRYGPYDKENPPEFSMPIEQAKIERKMYGLPKDRKIFLKDGDLVSPQDPKTFLEWITNKNLQEKNKKILNDPFFANRAAMGKNGYEIPENVLPIQKAKKFNDPFASVHDIYEEGQLNANQKAIDELLTPISNNVENSKTKQNLDYLRHNNPSGKVSVGYGDFRTSGEKLFDALERKIPKSLTQAALEAPEVIGKVLHYAGPPLAAADLIRKGVEGDKAMQEDMDKRGMAPYLAETGLDLSTLLAPLARLGGGLGVEGMGALAGGLETGGAGLAGYLAGKQVQDLMGGEPPANYGQSNKGGGEPEVVPPEQGLNEKDADKMYNYNKIKNLLKK